MNNEPKDDPRSRARNLLGSSTSSPLTRLPKKNEAAASFLPKQDDAPVKKEVHVEQKTPPKATVATPTQPKPARVSKGMNLNFGPPFWTIASAISMVVNIVLLIVVLALLGNIQKLNMGSALGIGNNLLGGLYTNFEKMDRAHIKTTIPVTTTIPVKFDLQLNQQTNVVLSQPVTITNALVTVNTGGLNITRAATTIVLPEGTTLPVFLNLTVPVDTTVPVTLNVDVDIPLENTELHEPFSGLQEVVKPFYCMISPEAVKLNGQPVCK
jgi:hypothetical protein